MPVEGDPQLVTGPGHRHLGAGVGDHHVLVVHRLRVGHVLRGGPVEDAEVQVAAVEVSRTPAGSTRNSSATTGGVS